MGIYGFVFGLCMYVGMEEGDHGVIGGAAAPARQVGAPTRRSDFSGRFWSLEELVVSCVLCCY